MPTLFTVGCEGRSLEGLIGDLLGAGVDRLVDVRELPLSRRRGFSKSALSGALHDAGIENGSRPALVALAASLDGDSACLLCVERDHTVCHRNVLVEALSELRPGLAISHL